MRDRVRDWFAGPPFGLRAFTRLDTLLALLLSAWAFVIVSGNGGSGDPRGGVFACAAVLR